MSARPQAFCSGVDIGHANPGPSGAPWRPDTNTSGRVPESTTPHQKGRMLVPRSQGKAGERPAYRNFSTAVHPPLRGRGDRPSFVWPIATYTQREGCQRHVSRRGLFGQCRDYEKPRKLMGYYLMSAISTSPQRRARCRPGPILPRNMDNNVLPPAAVWKDTHN